MLFKYSGNVWLHKGMLEKICTDWQGEQRSHLEEKEIVKTLPLKATQAKRGRIVTLADESWKGTIPPNTKGKKVRVRSPS